MAKPRIQIEAHGPVADVVWFMAAVNTQLLGKDEFDRPYNWEVEPSRKYRNEDVSISHFRLNDRREADSFWTWLASEMPTIQTRLSGIKTKFHICPHEDPRMDRQYNCKTHPSAEYSEREWWS